MRSGEGADIGGGDSAFHASMDDGSFERKMQDETRAWLDALQEMPAAFGEAATEAASVLERSPKGWVPEKALEQELLSRLRARVPGFEWKPRQKIPIPTWTPGLGGVDLVGSGMDSPSVFAELKIENVDESLWDIFKIVDLPKGELNSAFIVVVAAQERWVKQADPAELFSPQPGDWAPHPTTQLFERYAAAWAWVTGPKGSKPRPTDLPAAIQIRTVTIAPLAREPDLELRIIQIRPDHPDDRMTPPKSPPTA